MARQEEGVCRASEEDRGEVVEGEVGEVQCVWLYTCVGEWVTEQAVQVLYSISCCVEWCRAIEEVLSHA